MQNNTELKLIDFESNLSTDMKQYFIMSTLNCINFKTGLDAFYEELLTDANYCRWLIENPNVLNSIHNLLLLYYMNENQYLQHIYTQIEM